MISSSNPDPGRLTPQEIDAVLGKDAAAPQPAPQPSDRSQEVYKIVLGDIAERAVMGKKKYGTVLKTHNGRNALWDVYQELIDAFFYIRQKLLEEGK
jgi:hypothetical protein